MGADPGAAAALRRPPARPWEEVKGTRGKTAVCALPRPACCLPEGIMYLSFLTINTFSDLRSHEACPKSPCHLGLPPFWPYFYPSASQIADASSECSWSVTHTGNRSGSGEAGWWCVCWAGTSRACRCYQRKGHLFLILTKAPALATPQGKRFLSNLISVLLACFDELSASVANTPFESLGS